ncbi:MAG: hypothetical protein ACP5HG_02390 [Anaerolineae bacterium]
MNDETEEIKATTSAQEEAAARERRSINVTFRGNSYDLTALGAFASGVLVLLSCLTCGQAFYCLPVIPLILGVIGIVMARDSVDAHRTRLWSWLGIGGSALTILLGIFAIASYVAFVLFLIMLSQTS